MQTVEDRIGTLPLWRGSDHHRAAARRPEQSRAGWSATRPVGHVVRFGKDYPFHHVLREREAMTARAAHAAGFAPEVHYAEPGVLVTAFLGAKTYAADDVRANSSASPADARAFTRRCRSTCRAPASCSGCSM